MDHAARYAYLAIAIVLAMAMVFIAVRARRGGSLRTGSVVVLVVSVLPLVYVGLTHAGVIRETYVRFHHPEALVACSLAGAFLAWRFSHLPLRMSKLRRALVIGLSTASVLAALFAVAEPELGKPLDRMTIMIAVDRSRSIDLVPGADSRVRNELRVAEVGMHADDRVGTIVFGANAAIEDPPRPKSDLPPPQRVSVGRDGTDLELAIRRALTELPADSASRLVILSDGVQTRGDALAAGAAAVAADVPVDVVVFDQKLVPDVRVVTVRAPPHADKDETIELRVVVWSAVETKVDVRVRRDGELIRKTDQPIAIARGENVLALREQATDPGLHRYDVEVTAVDPAADAAPEDNSGSTFIKVRGATSALVMEGDIDKAAPLAAALAASGFKVTEVSTTGVPSDIGGLANYDVVVLSDIRASDLSTTQVDAIASYARDLGGGLVLMGGDRSMGPGGYARTPIEEVSPVAFDLKQDKRRASLAEVIAIDFSGSMGAYVSGQTKLSLANEAAARSASLLGPGDRLGVEHVDTSVHWTVPMGPVTDVGKIGAEIRGVDVGGGGIYTDISLEAGYAALDKETVNLKHMLLFADGSDAEQIAGCRALVKRAFDRGMTTSVISLGRGSDSPELEVLSKIGGGRFYLIEDATKLPAVFTQETILAARSSLHEVDFKADTKTTGGPTRGVDFGASPILKGYVVTVPKSRAAVYLTGPDGDPVLATWAAGIGRVAAFTSDYKNRWGQQWLGWGDAAKLFGQVARDVARKADDPRVRLESDASGGELHVRADVVGDDGRAQTFRRLTIHVAGPDGFSRDVPLDAVGAGRYAASIPLDRPGTYIAAAKDEVSGESVGTTGAALGAGEELRPTGSDRALLSRLAAMTGGKVRDTLAGIFDDRAAKRFAYSPLATPLVLFAALAMLLAVASRRLGIPDVAVRLAARAKERRAEAARRRSEEASEFDRQRRLADAEQQRLKEVLLARRQKNAPGASILGDAPGDGARRSSEQGPIARRRAEPGGRVAPAKPAAPAERQLTVAERLAIKRRERK
jgi:Ca-activated chloride channel family protein